MESLGVIASLAGACIGGALGSGGRVICALWGALLGLGLSHIVVLRDRLAKTDGELSALRGAVEAMRRPAPPVTRPTGPAATTRVTTPVNASAFAPDAAPRVAPFPAPAAPLDATPRDSSDFRGESAPKSPSSLWLQNWIEGGNWLVRSGIVILFFGTAFLLRYVAQHTHVPISLRLSSVAVAAVGLLALGWRLRHSRPAYALALQGGAIGIEYLTVFVAEHVYALLSPAVALTLLSALSIFLVAMAIRQSSQALALLALVGGFLAPVLVPTGDRGEWPMFCYYLVLNGVILSVAGLKSWRSLNLAGLVSTFAIATVWRVLIYRPDHLAIAEPFLIVFFLLYVAVGVLFTRRQPSTWWAHLDGPVVFATPLFSFLLQASLLTDQRTALAWSAIAGSALYGVLVVTHNARDRQRCQALIDAFFAIAVTFLTIAIPIGLGSRWHIGAWALEGSSLVWFGCRQQRSLTRIFGGALIVLAGLRVLPTLAVGGLRWQLPIADLLPALLVSAASILSAWLLHKLRSQRSTHDPQLAEALGTWSVVFWILGGLGVLPHRVADHDLSATCLVWLCVTSLAASVLHGRLPLRALHLTGWSLLPIMLAFSLRDAAIVQHPFQHAGLLAWPLAFTCLALVAAKLERTTAPSFMRLAQPLAAWLLTALLSWETAFDVHRWTHGGQVWTILGWAWIPTGVLFALPRVVPKVRWPLLCYRATYELVIACGLAAFLAVWSVISDLLLSGDVAPLRYVPILNPIDVTQLLVITVVYRHVQRIRGHYPGLDRDLPRNDVLIAGAGFLWINATLLRTLHQWAHVPLDVDRLMQSTLAQTCLSITWTLTAIGSMMIANRTAARALWNAGAILLGIVILKLFAVDLAASGSIERIVSFVGVGLLLLLVGYFSPRPPAHDDF